MKVAGALVLAFVPLACTLVVDTDGFTGGAPNGDGGSSGSTADGNVTADGSMSTSGGVDGGGVDDSGNPNDATFPTDGPPPRFCPTVKPTLSLQWCDDFDEENRTALAANGWSLLQGGGDQEKTGLSLASEPKASGTRSARIVEDVATGHGRTRIARSVVQGKDFSIHFKYFRSALTADAPIMMLQGTDCAIAISPKDVYSFCPSYAPIYDLPDAPENAWNEMTITIEEHSPTSRFFITAPGIAAKRVDVPPVNFASVELGQDSNDHTQTIFFDDVWVEFEGD